MVHICDICSREYTRADSLNRHVNNKDHQQDGWDECPKCGDYYNHIGNHWQHNPNHRPSLTKYQREVVTGLLMGDGCINRQQDTLPRFTCSMVTKPFIEYLNNEIFPLLGSIREVEPGENNVQMQYALTTSVHPELSEFEAWYTSDGKLFPKDIELTPTVLKMWYVSDGCLDNYYSRTCPSIASANEAANQQKLINYFESVGIRVRRTTWKDLIFEYVENGNFFDYIGDAPPGFEHKWPEKYR